MGWFGRLFGGGGVPGESRGQTRARQLLDRTAALAALTDVVIAQTDEYQCELRGTLRGMPVRLIVDHDGEVREFQLRHDSPASACIDLEYDPDRKATRAGPALPAWDEGDHVIDVGPGVFIEGSDARKEHAAFLRLPPALQARVLETMARRRIMYFRSRPDEHDISFHDSGRELADKPAAYAEVLLLAGEVARARSAVPPRPTRSPDDEGDDDEGDDDGAAVHDATKLAGQIATRIPGATVVVREDDACIDVRWTEHGTSPRLVLDVGTDSLDVEVNADGVMGEFALERDVDVVAGRDDAERHVFVGAAVFVAGPLAAVRTQAALLHALPAALLDEVVRAMTELDLGLIHLQDQLLTVTVGDLAHVVDQGAAGTRVARLLARLAAALPRAAVVPTAEPQRCAACAALWYPTPSRSSCRHCGAAC